MSATAEIVARRKAAAYWYAVGWSDATGQPDLSDEFARYAEAQATEFYAERTTSLRSVPDQWREFQASRG